MVKGILVQVNGTVTAKDFPDFKAYQAAVGGWVEAFPLRGAGMVAIVNEEGKLRNLPYNPMATALAVVLGGIASPDYIVGDMVLVGSADRNGDETGLSEAKITKVLEVSRKIAKDLGVGV